MQVLGAWNHRITCEKMLEQIREELHRGERFFDKVESGLSEISEIDPTMPLAAESLHAEQEPQSQRCVFHSMPMLFGIN